MSAVKRARKEAGFSITKAAIQLKISPGYLSEIERGFKQVASGRADAISKLYGKKKEDIFFASRYAVREVKAE